MGVSTGMFDLEKHYAFYGAYHTNPINILIHTVLVWPNVFAALLFLYAAPPFLDLSKLGFFDGVLRLDIGLIHAMIHAIFYVCMDKKSGVLAALMCISCWIGSSFLAARMGLSLTLTVGIAVQFFCFVGQFFAHAVFEVMQAVFGYEPYPGFKKRVDSKIESEIKIWREKTQQKKVT
ncbi:unnamed protein product [Microthlaspi erraticum]|uniref:Uncharacterized protein n=1 Tax=Microthlaspi erraticum TaxID=1685480 RepID=A0A6D2JTV1_9BRAS|nr:unnamed protein product [Microthlaspi erraticum]